MSIQVFSRSIFLTLTFSFFVFHCNAASIAPESTKDASASQLEQLEARIEARIRSEVQQQLQSYVQELEAKLAGRQLLSREDRSVRVDGQPPASCADLFVPDGPNLPGFFMVKKDKVIATVYCDFANNGTNDDVVIGHNAFKSNGGVYFTARDGSSDKGDNTDITYKTLTSNSTASGMDKDKGIFTAPVAGTYFFAATVNKDSDNPSTYLILRQGDNEVASSYCPTHASSQHCSVAATLILNAGDKVRATKDGNNLYKAEFTGFLIDETLTLTV